MTTTSAAGSVAVGYNATPHSDVALAWAVRHAAAIGRPLMLVHACGVPSGYVGVGSVVQTKQDLRVAGRAVLDAGLAEARRLDPRVELREHLAIGSSREVLLSSLDGAHLLVVGSRGHGRIAAFVLGSVSEGVSALAPCPVVVARAAEHADAQSPFADRVVVGVDGTDLSRRALLAAFELASVSHRVLAVLHSWGDAVRWRDLTSYEQALETAEEHDLQVGEAMAGLSERFPDVAVSVHQVEDDPGRALVEASRHADAVVVGSRGRGDTAAVLFGSVSRHVVEHAHCPVLVARDPGLVHS